MNFNEIRKTLEQEAYMTPNTNRYNVRLFDQGKVSVRYSTSKRPSSANKVSRHSSVQPASRFSFKNGGNRNNRTLVSASKKSISSDYGSVHQDMMTVLDNKIYPPGEINRSKYHIEKIYGHGMTPKIQLTKKLIEASFKSN